MKLTSNLKSFGYRPFDSGIDFFIRKHDIIPTITMSFGCTSFGKHPMTLFELAILSRAVAECARLANMAESREQNILNLYGALVIWLKTV